ncbi:MAG: uncharacterized protein QOD77_888 [Thermoplasmata archaeon]|jgi:predicted TIM-barrel fold metal-dependent hydrolase|nr:uncharacterized protein [Thermoplasmata archaeon]
MRPIDAHVHVNRFDLMTPAAHALIAQNPTFPQMERFVRDPDAFLAHLDAEGIEAAWLVNYCAKEVMGYGWEVNPWIAEYCAADPRRLVAVGGYDPRHDGDGAAAIGRLRDLGVRALKLHPVHQRVSPADPALWPAYARLEELGMPLLVHTGTSIFPGADNAHATVAPLAQVLAAFPGLPVILCHGGRPNETAQALALLDRFPNARIDLSSCPPARLPHYFGDLAARADRFLWGSDWPGPKVPGMGANVAAFRALGLPAAAEEQILWRNARALVP